MGEHDDVAVIQALALLAVIDATGKKFRDEGRMICAEILSSRSTSERVGEDWNGSSHQSGLENDVGA